MPAPVTPIFQRFRLGEVRDAILNDFRASLRTLVDPSTGQLFTEDVIRQATMQGSRYWVEAESIDIIGQGFQRRAEFLATQVDPRRASTHYLETYHGPAAQLPRLDGTGGSGLVTALGTPGTRFVGSTSVPDVLATRAQDQAGKRYQVFTSQTVPGNASQATLLLQAIDTGRETNLEPNTVLTWINPPPGAAPTCTVTDAFRGGTEQETDQEWSERLFDAKASKPRAGNPAHFRLWARRASNAVADAFVYPCALHAGSVVVCVVAKRGSSVAYDARIPTVPVMRTLVDYLTPPTSPIVPAGPHVVVVAAVPEQTNATVSLAMARGSGSGWADLSPWPAWNASPPQVLSVASATEFTMSAPSPQPPGVTPKLMVWRPEVSAFEELKLAGPTTPSGPNRVVTLTQAPLFSLVPGLFISPYTARHAAIARGLIAHFDSLGPGEIVSSDDQRYARAFRRPRTGEIAGATLPSFISDATGGLVQVTLRTISRTTPTIPTSASTGPYLLVPYHFGVYSETN